MAKRADQQGFTLVELLVVIAIIGILASMSIIGLNRQQAKTRDARRVGDLNTIRTGLTSYIADNFEPKKVSAYTSVDGGGWDYSSEKAGAYVEGGDADFIKFLSDSGVMTKVPQDPINNGTGDVQNLAGDGKGYAYGYNYYPDYPPADLNGMITYRIGTRLEVAVTPIYQLVETLRKRQ